MVADEFRRRVRAAIDGRRIPTSHALAERAGVKPQTLHKFLTTPGRGTSRPTVEGIARVLEWPVEEALRWADLAPAQTGDDPLAEIQRVLYRGPWSETTAALMYAVLAELANDRRTYWRQRYEAITAQVADSELLAILRQPITEQAKLEALTAAIGHLVFSQPPSLPSLHPD